MTSLIQPVLDAKPYLLRPFESTDIGVVREASRDPFIPLITTVPAGGSDEELSEFIHQQNQRAATGAGYSFAIAESQTNEAVGQIGLWLTNAGRGRASIGYWIASSQRKKGIAAIALDAIARWALTLPSIHRVELYVEPWNEGSWRTAERCGFMREGLMRSWEDVGQERKDMYMYSRLRETSV